MKTIRTINIGENFQIKRSGPEWYIYYNNIHLTTCRNLLDALSVIKYLNNKDVDIMIEEVEFTEEEW